MTTATKTEEPYIDRFFDAFEDLWGTLNEHGPYRRTLTELRAHPATVSNLISSLAGPAPSIAHVFQGKPGGGPRVGELMTQAGPMQLMSFPRWRPFGGRTLREGLVLLMNDLGAGVGLIDMEHKHKPKTGIYTNTEFIRRVIDETADPEPDVQAPFALMRRKAAWNF
jgi:hypothetical protein